jgi:D-glycero-D-manno-heptose 1,7-bisphosphate phosphatase
MSEKAIFLDRDDTLIEDPGYINSPEQVKLLDGVPEALIELKALGYKLVVATNQSAVARGIVTEKVLGEIHDRLKHLLAERNAFLDQIYYCPYHPEGVVPKYRKESNWRKPNPGMLQQAAQEMDIDLGQSWCIGNSSRDVEAGRRAGCKTILIDKPSYHKVAGSSLLPIGIAPDHRAVNIKEAVNIIKKHLRSSAAAQVQARPVPAGQAEPASQVSQPVREAAEAASQVSPEVSEIAQAQAPVEEQPAGPQGEQPQVQPVEPPPQAPAAAEPKAEPGGEARRQPPEPIIHPPEPKRRPVEPPAIKRIELKPQPPEPQPPADKTQELLSGILAQLKSMQRAEMFGEFSAMRLIAGVVQIIVLFCLLVTVWFLMSPQRQDSSVFIALGLAVVFQLMALTFYVMQGRK